MMKKLILVFVTCLAATVFAQQTQPCPFSREQVEKLDFKPISTCIFNPTAVTQTACDACVCSFVDATLPLWIEGNLVDCAIDFAADSAVATTTLNNLMTTCAMVIGPKLSRDLGINLFQLPRLFVGVQSCPVDAPPPMCLLEAIGTLCPSNSHLMTTAPMMEI